MSDQFDQCDARHFRTGERCAMEAEHGGDRHSFDPENPCPFCEYDGPSPVLTSINRVVVIEPLDPVVEGHLLAIPHEHVEDLATDPSVTARVMGVAAQIVRDLELGDCNLITSRGEAATQTVMHLHVHIVPRREMDCLVLPWSNKNRGQINGQPFSLPDGYNFIDDEQLRNLRQCRALLGELDRSENGRHEDDSEVQDPTGTSQGNPKLKAGTHIGYHISGKRIIVPHWKDLQNPDAWLEGWQP